MEKKEHQSSKEQTEWKKECIEASKKYRAVLPLLDNTRFSTLEWLAKWMIPKKK